MTGKLSLTLEATKSALEGITCWDIFDIEKLKKIANSTLLKDSEEWNETKQIDKYLFKLKHGEKEVKYYRTPKMSFGRVTPKNNLGLSMIRKEIRNTIANGYYYDIDAVNCHYVILEQVCKANEIKCDKISEYINKRSDMLEAVCKEFNKITKDEAKQLFIMLIYGASLNKWYKDNNLKVSKSSICIYLQELYDQLHVIAKDIIIANSSLSKEVERNKILKEQKQYNHEASCLSYYLQEWECRMLEAMYLYFKKNNYITNNNVVLCADGIMIRSTQEVEGNDCFKPEKVSLETITKELKSLQEYVEERVGLKMNFVIKPMTLNYLDILEQNQKDIVKSPNCYESIKKEFELTHFKVMHPSTIYATIYNGEMIIKDKKDFNNCYENKFFVAKESTKEGIIDKDKPFTIEWMKDPNIRTYSKTEFLPNQKVSDDIYNTFTGYEAAKQPQVDGLDIKESLIYKHLKNICGNDENVISYFEMFLSRKLRNPSKLPNVSLIFKSIQGCGKDTLFDYIGNNILGKQYYYNNDSIDSIFGHFNKSIQDKIMVVLTEPQASQTYQMDKRIMAAITQVENRIEYKGFEAFNQQNCISYVFLTNDNSPLKIDMNDRRFVGITCNDKIANNYKYFTELRDEMKSKKYDRALYDYLMNIDSDNFDFVSKRPITSYYENMKEQNMPIIFQFAEDLIFHKEDETELIAYSSDLFSLYNEFLKASNYKFDYTSTKFGIDMKRFESIEKKRLNNGIKYIINYFELEKELVLKKIIEPITDEMKEYLKQQTPPAAPPAAPASTDVDSDKEEIVKIPDNWFDKKITVVEEEKPFNNNKRIDFEKVKKVKKNEKVEKVEKVECVDKDDYAVFKTKKIPVSALSISFD